jgi:hypothetical protein
MKKQKYIVTVDQWGTEWRNEAGKLHRLDGPAIEQANGAKSWFVDGKLHRLDGAAIEWSNGDKEWWIEGAKYTEKQFNKKVKQLQNKSCEGKIVEIDGVKYKLTSV